MLPPKILDAIETPALVLDEARLVANLETAATLKRATGCKVLLATKAWALPAAFPLMRPYLDGTTASGEYEARMGFEEFGKEVHVYAPAYGPGEVDRVLQLADHIYFNSPAEVARYLPRVKAAGKHAGIRVNPGYSNATLGGALYDPCAPGSRFGTTPAELDKLPWGDLHILHTHALCESLHDGSVGLIDHVARTLGPYVRRVKAVNFGGGHFINKPGYVLDKLIAAIRAFKAEFDVEVILEPGAGLVVDTGYLVASVLDLHWNETPLAILDTSASTHMPDVLEVPYTPTIIGAGKPGEKPYTYSLGGKTCMTGDVIGDYSFDAPLQVGQKLVFTDMMQYSFVKVTTFNGTPLPSIGRLDRSGRYDVLQRFGYAAYRDRLGPRAAS